MKCNVDLQPPKLYKNELESFFKMLIMHKNIINSNKFRGARQKFLPSFQVKLQRISVLVNLLNSRRSKKKNFFEKSCSGLLQGLSCEDSAVLHMCINYILLYITLDHLLDKIKKAEITIFGSRRIFLKQVYRSCIVQFCK